MTFFSLFSFLRGLNSSLASGGETGQQSLTVGTRSVSQTFSRPHQPHISPVLFGSFVHRGHPYLPVAFGSPVLTESLILQEKWKEWNQSEGAEFNEGEKRAAHQVFYRFLVLVYFSQRLVVSLHFVDVLSQVLHTVTKATEGKQHLVRD